MYSLVVAVRGDLIISKLYMHSHSAEFDLDSPNTICNQKSLISFSFFLQRITDRHLENTTANNYQTIISFGSVGQVTSTAKLGWNFKENKPVPDWHQPINRWEILNHSKKDKNRADPRYANTADCCYSCYTLPEGRQQNTWRNNYIIL
jgi:hypothetical protein